MTRGVRRSPWQATQSAKSSAAPMSERGTRNAERGTDWDGSILRTSFGTRRARGPFRLPRSAFRILLLAERQQVREQPIGAGDAGRKLSEEAQPRVDVGALAEPCQEQAALERRVARVVRLEQRRVRGVPVVREVEPPLLHPAPPVGWADVVGHPEHRTGGIERGDRAVSSVTRSWGRAIAS